MKKIFLTMIITTLVVSMAPCLAFADVETDVPADQIDDRHEQKSRIYILIGIIYSILIVLWYMSGYFRDNHPQVIIPSYINWLFYTLVVSIPITTLLLGMHGRERKIVQILIIVNCCAIIIFFTAAGKLVYFTHLKYTHDYIKSENINGISLTSVEEHLADSNDYILYFGRNDCKECNLAEKIIDGTLNQSELIIQGYYTNLDRDKSSSKHMYEVLDSLDVHSVPTLIYKSKSGEITNISIKQNDIQKYVEMINKQNE